MEFHSSDLAISWLRDHYLDGRLVIGPSFQRRLVWKHRQKSHLIESILLGYPIPELFVQQATTPAGVSTFTVVDGQQRIAALLAFLGVLPADQHNAFELKYVDDGSPWRNATFEGLSDTQKVRFYDTLISVRMLSGAGTADIKQLFIRFNKYLTKLTDQELRNATYSGPLIQMAMSIAEDDYFAKNRIVTPEDIRRMRDIEFLSELIIGLIHGPQQGSGAAIDEFYAQYEEADTLPAHAALKRRFQRTQDTIDLVLPEIAGTRWSNKTDYYTLFVAVGQLLVDHTLISAKENTMAKALRSFEKQIKARLADEDLPAADHVVQYVRAVEKGVSDKTRRSNRHLAMLHVIRKYFKKRSA